MGLDAKAGFVGLVTAAGEMTAGQGALRVADNVTLRKEGALALRSFFGSTALSRQYAAAFPYKGALLYLSGTNTLYSSAQAVLSYSFDEGSGTRFGQTSPALRADVQGAKEARDNFYVAANAGVFKVTSTTGAILAAGVSPPPGISGVNQDTTGSTLLGANQRVAYRLVHKVTNNGGMIVRSRPTGALVVESAATAFNPVLSITGPSYTDGRKSEIEIYRTRTFPNTVVVDEEMQLIATVPSLNTGGSPNIFYTDRIADASRGTTLYTSPSRGGAENANDRPPGCACIERYRGSLFFGYTRGPLRVTVSYKWGGDVTGQAAGIGARSATVAWNNGSATVTVSSAVGLQVGMLFRPASSPTYNSTLGSPTIASIAGTTLTMTHVADSTRSGVTAWFYDTFATRTSASWPGVFVVAQPPGSTIYGGFYGGNSLSYYLSGATSTYELTPAVPGYTYTLVIETYARGAGTLAVRATHGDEYSSPIALGTDATGTLGTYDDFPNGLAWSEPDEPEHVPPKNFARVGDAGKAILALVATKDRLLIFKEDGLFMLTGDTAKNFAIYPLDTTALCILPGSVKRLQNTVYALTNLGLVAVDDSGSVQVVSRPVQTELAPIVTAIRQAQASSGLYNMPGLSGVTGTADDPNNEYWLMLGTTTPSFGGQMLVYNAFRQGFTTYSFGTPTPVAVSQDGSGQPLVLTASTLLTPSTSLGAITARISPRAFSDPALVGKLWTHVVAGFSKLTGTASVTAKFSGSESMVDGTEVTEVMEAPTSAGLIQLPGGSLLRHPMPRAMARAFLTFVEVVVAVTNGTFTLEVLGAETRENIPNKRPTHGTGAT